MKALISLLTLILFVAVGPARAEFNGPITPTGPLAFTPTSVFNITDYGAKCDGTTNDNTAINAAFAAAAASAAYQSNNAVSIVGPKGALAAGCVINSINATIFTKGNGANTRPQVEVADMVLLCTGAGNTCFDATGSTLIKMHDVGIRGDVSPNSPEICIQVAIDSGASSAWHMFEHVNCNNEFTLTALYNFGSEANTYLDDMFVNAHTASGPIGVLGAITGGSSYTNGTYTAVPLTGGSGTGALATVVVAANAVTTVTITYEGRDYAPSDSLSANAASIGGTGSGFSVPVSTVTPYAVILDGQNHWRAASAFQTISNTPDAWVSLTLTTFIAGSARQLGTGPSAMWVAWSPGVHTYNYYMLGANGAACLSLFNNGVTKSGITSEFIGADFEFSCEGTTNYAIQLVGSNATPKLQDVRYHGGTGSTVAVIGTVPTITGVTATNINFNKNYTGSPLPMFSKAAIWHVSGIVNTLFTEDWNSPVTFSGTVVAGAVSAPIGPLDILSGAAQAWSCARQLSQTYKGPLCNVERTSDSTSIDLYPNAAGDLDRSGFQSFCNGTTCQVATAYDQSGNGNNFTQSTVASQPTLAISQIGGRPALLFGDQSAIAMTATSTASLTNIFDSGGYMTAVANPTQDANAADELLYKTNASFNGWNFRYNTGTTSPYFEKWASTSPGIFITGSLHTTTPILYDVQYSASSVSNVPTIGTNGVAATLATSTAPVGTFLTDSAINLLLGNSAATGGSRGFPGYLAESILWKTTPTATQLEAIRRNEGAYYGILAQ